MRLFWLIGSLALALLIAVLTLQVPAPVGEDAPATTFSAGMRPSSGAIATSSTPARLEICSQGYRFAGCSSSGQ